MSDIGAIACMLCGGDAATEAMIVNAAVAGGLSVPIYFRRQAMGVVRRLRGLDSREDPAACEVAEDSEDDPQA
jgi:hypothetical protein